MKRIFCFLCTVLILFPLSACTGKTAEHTLCISEVQSAGGESDWIELYNYGNRAVSLQGWYVTDDPDSPGKSALPLITLKSGERLTLRSGKELAFKLDAGGETIVLNDPQGRAVQTLELPASVPGLSYGCIEDGALPPARFVWYAAPTPNRPNGEGMILGQNATNTALGVRINEFVTRNKTSLYDNSGDYGDWIELYNTTDRTVDISAWSLTDTEEDTARWRFPQGTSIPAHGYLLIFCDGKNTVNGNELHTSFRLSGTDGFLGLYTADGTFCSGVTCPAAEQDTAYGCNENGETVRCRYPTPGRANAAKEVSP